MKLNSRFSKIMISSSTTFRIPWSCQFPSLNHSFQLRNFSKVQLNSSLHEEKIPLIVLNPMQPLTWYTCGPTVYDNSHLGHARTYVTIDIIQRILEKCFGFQLFRMMGVTDVDDKIIIKAKEEKREISQIAQHFEKEFFHDMQKLGVRQPTVILRVTDHISEIIQFIEGIIKNGYGYVAPSGSVYFRTKNFKNYGKAFHISQNESEGIFDIFNF